jgi:small-conductance mechanosensitive channel
MKEIQEDEVLFEKIDEDLVTVETTSTNLSQTIAHNVTMLNVKLSQEESENVKLKDEIINLREEMNKQRKVECDMTPLKENILKQQEQRRDVKMEFFTKI